VQCYAFVESDSESVRLLVQKRPRCVAKLFTVCRVAAFFELIFWLVSIFILRERLAQFYSSDPAVIALATGSLLPYLTHNLFDGVNGSLQAVRTRIVCQAINPATWQPAYIDVQYAQSAPLDLARPGWLPLLLQLGCSLCCYTWRAPLPCAALHWTASTSMAVLTVVTVHPYRCCRRCAGADGSAQQRWSRSPRGTSWRSRSPQPCVLSLGSESSACGAG
jgi:hypothetical protein